MHWLWCDTAEFSKEDLQQAYARLSPSRKAHIDRLRQEEDKRRSLAAELLVHKLLREHCGITGAVLHRKPNGQPYLTGCDLYVSIAHSAQMVACAVSPQPVGIDVEQIRPMDLKICRHVCVPEEKAYIGHTQEQYCENADILYRFFEIWTAKEAYFKKCGTGITDLKSVNVLTLPRQPHRIGDYVLQII